jgi:hypothetical protein
MAKIDKPQCQHCFGTNWNDLGQFRPAEEEIIEGEMVETVPALHLWQCGHGPAHAEEMNNGCSRIITATKDQMSKGGTI